MEDLSTTDVSIIINGVEQNVEVTVTMEPSLIAAGIDAVTENDPFIKLAVMEWMAERDKDVPIYSYVSDDGKLTIDFEPGTYVNIEVDPHKVTTVWLFSSSCEGRLKIDGWGGLFNSHIDQVGVILKDSFLFNQQSLSDGFVIYDTTLIKMEGNYRGVHIS